MYFPTLGSIATQKVIYLNIDATVNMAVEKMNEHNHRNVIIKSRTLYYVFTTRDMIRLTLEKVPFSTPFSQLSLQQVPLLHKDENVIMALEFLDKNNEYICVCDDDDELYGLVTNNDIVASVDPQIMMENLTLGSMFDAKYGFITLQQHQTMRQAMSDMHEASTDCIIVADAAKPLGIVTSKDILKYFKENHAEELTLAHFMNGPLQTLHADSTISEALAFLQAKAYKRIVVADDDGQVIGIISEQELISRTYLKWSGLVKEHFNEFEELTQILSQKNKQLTKIATRDALTNIANRHLFEELFEKESAQLKRYGKELALVMLDIDRFKVVNDTYGHTVGDYVLKELAAVVSANIRESDTFARWGGEEFILLLPNTALTQAAEVAEKLRHSIETHVFEGVGTITSSFGVGNITPDETLVSAMEKVDKALYRAKDEGRNRVICA